MKKLLILLTTIALFSSCAKHITVQYQPVKENTGTVTILPSKNTVGTTVTINDSLIVRKKKVKSLTITNVPEGTHTIQYNTDNSNYKYPLDTAITVEMKPNKELTKTVKVPPYSTGYYVYRGLAMVAGILLFIFL